MSHLHLPHIDIHVTDTATNELPVLNSKFNSIQQEQLTETEQSIDTMEKIEFKKPEKKSTYLANQILKVPSK